MYPALRWGRGFELQRFSKMSSMVACQRNAWLALARTLVRTAKAGAFKRIPSLAQLVSTAVDVPVISLETFSHCLFLCEVTGAPRELQTVSIRKKQRRGLQPKIPMRPASFRFAIFQHIETALQNVLAVKNEVSICKDDSKASK